MKSRRLRWLIAGAGMVVLLFALGPWMVSAWWGSRSSNPVRRGVQRAGELGCFACHGEMAQAGIVDPGDPEEGVPGWGGSVWMMYVQNDEEIRKYILDGSLDDHTGPEDSENPEGAQASSKAIHMPAYRQVLGGSDLDDLVAAFKVLSGMVKPAGGTPARRGRDLARKWDCEACHGAGGSGGLANPGSFTGFIPGWYGADFEDLVRDRAEFDAWVREGSVTRLNNHFLASRYLDSQRISMPTYRNLRPSELDDLWAYTRWLQETGGGHEGKPAPW